MNKFLVLLLILFFACQTVLPKKEIILDKSLQGFYSDGDVYAIVNVNSIVIASSNSKNKLVFKDDLRVYKECLINPTNQKDVYFYIFFIEKEKKYYLAVFLNTELYLVLEKKDSDI